MEQTELEEIRKQFKLRARSKKSIIDALKKIQKSNHPDRTHSSGDQPINESLFRAATEALERIQSPDQGRITVQDDNAKLLVTLQRELIESRAKATERNELEDLRQTVHKARAVLKSRLALPRISSAAIAAIMTAIFAFPRSFAEHPFLGKYLQGHNWELFSFLYLHALLLTATVWLITKWSEQSLQSRMELLMRENTQTRLFASFISRLTHDSYLHETIGFTASALIQYISEQLPPRGGIYRFTDAITMGGYRRSLQFGAAEKTANIILLKAVEKKILTVSSNRTLEDHYSIQKEDALRLAGERWD